MAEHASQVVAGKDRTLARASRAVRALRQAALDAEREFEAQLCHVAPGMRDSARNLVHYLAVRRHDIRDLQSDLSRLGLSSLGRMEAHVLATLDAVLTVLCRLQGQRPPPRSEHGIDFDTGTVLLALHADDALGHAPGNAGTRIMVTMPGEGADDPDFIDQLLQSGMDLMRVNCAHDDRSVWEALAKHLRYTCERRGKRCLLSFDLAGPKLRTGGIEPGPEVMKWRPRRSAVGRVVEPAKVWLTRPEGCRDFDEPALAVEGDLLDKVRVGDSVVFNDARERRRELRVIRVRDDACLCQTESTAYVMPGTRMRLRRNGRSAAHAIVSALPKLEHAIQLRVGDALDLVLGEGLGRDAVHDENGNVLSIAKMTCAVPELFKAVHVGEPIFFDDGKIRGIVVSTSEDRLRVEITGVAGGTAKLRADKGINLPESELALPSLTATDREDLAAVVPHADLIALSFVRRPEDVEDLQRLLHDLGAQHVGIVLKIETRTAFECLPRLLLAAMRHEKVAVMVARGDLGVEVGFERLSEVQEETLWLCEAAHVPVIWATQVLESLAKAGAPTRAEVSDAAMGGRAECVMLNKGPYIREALQFLRNVLDRMQEHQYKKTARLRKLHVSAASQHGGKVQCSVIADRFPVGPIR